MSIEVANLNNQALYMLINKQYDAALTLFSAAVNIQHTMVYDKHSNLRRTTTYYSLRSNSNSRSRSILPARIPVLCRDEASSPHNGFIFYQRIFYISPQVSTPTPPLVNDNEINVIPEDDDSDYDEQSRPGRQRQVDDDSKILLMTLYFNIAATCHRIGLERNSIYFIRALEYYNKILALSKDINERNMDILHKSGYKVILLASTTNIGHIYSHYCEPDEAEKCRTFLSYIITENIEVRFFMDTEEYLSFFLSSSLFTNANMKIQAAATA